MTYFRPPGNPLAYYDGTRFVPARLARTRDGRVCYFCRTIPDGSVAPCCPAAQEWREDCRRRAEEYLTQWYGQQEPR